MPIAKSQTKISFAAAEKLLREAGAQRVSDSAKKAFVALLEEKGAELAKSAVNFAHHTGRITITEKDILATKK